MPVTLLGAQILASTLRIPFINRTYVAVGGYCNVEFVMLPPDGNLGVANSIANSITEYSPSGAQDRVHTITTGISNPSALAFDGISDLWVQNGNSSVSVWRKHGRKTWATSLRRAGRDVRLFASSVRLCRL